jgi:hypothetical protein
VALSGTHGVLHGITTYWGALRYYGVLPGTPRYSRSALDTQEVPDLCPNTHAAMYCSGLQRGGTAHKGTRGVLTSTHMVARTLYLI